jgi:hypothetical protein
MRSWKKTWVWHIHTGGKERAWKMNIIIPIEILIALAIAWFFWMKP